MRACHPQRGARVVAVEVRGDSALQPGEEVRAGEGAHRVQCTYKSNENNEQKKKEKNQEGLLLVNE